MGELAIVVDKVGEWEGERVREVEEDAEKVGKKSQGLRRAKKSRR